MRILNSAIRTSGERQPRAYVLAAIVTSVLPAAAATVFLWLVPSACDIRGDEAIYRWLCLLPGLLIVVPIAVAFVLSFTSFLNARFGRRFPDGWFVTITGVGLRTHVVLSVSYLLALGPAYVEVFFREVIFIPQPFVAGATAAAVFWLTLHRDSHPG